MANSFLTNVTDIASDVEQAVVDGFKAAASEVENIVVTDIEPELVSALQTALSIFGSTALASFLAALSPGATVTAPAALTSTDNPAG